MPTPPTRTADVIDDYFGVAVPDPYRWLEDSDGVEAQDWLTAQHLAARAYLDARPGRAAIADRVAPLVALPRRGLPVRRGERWFRTENDGVAQQDVFVVADSPMGPGRVLLDPNAEAADASTSLAAAVPNPDGTLVAYSWSQSGSDWRTWRVRDVASGVDRPDAVPWSKFTVATWLPDGSGFVWGGYDAPAGDEYTDANRGHLIRLHRLETEPATDGTVLALPAEPDVTFWPQITDDGRWLVITGSVGTEHAGRVWVRDLSDPDSALRCVITEATAEWVVVGSTGDRVVMYTDLDAPRGRLVLLDPATGAVTGLVAQRDDILAEAIQAGGRLVAHWLHDARSVVSVHSLDGGEIGVIGLPGPGSVTELSGHDDETLVHLAYTSFTDPPQVLAHDVAERRTHTAFSPDTGLDPSRYATEQQWVTSRDGTRLPVFLVHRVDVSPEQGPHPALLYGYGGFRIPVTPAFDAMRFAFVDAGGVLAVPSLRGGGEYGAEWHDGGRGPRKQNVFDDAIATAQHLVAAGWTDAAHLAATGRSNGGLLAGALATQRPDLFAAVVPEVGVLDLLRFTEFTIGWAWISDYGDPRRSRAEFEAALAYSPLHQLREATEYPPMLVMTSDHDDRVVPAHSMKFAARLQAVSAPDAVALLRVEPATGHGAGRPRHAIVAERVDVLAFLAAHTGLRLERGRSGGEVAGVHT